MEIMALSNSHKLRAEQLRFDEQPHNIIPQ